MQEQPTNNDTTTPLPANYTPGLSVYDPAGNKIGLVSEQQEPGYLVVKQGVLFTHDIYLPESAVGAVEEDAIYLLYTKDELLGRTWGTPPSTQTASDGHRAAMEMRPDRETIQQQIKTKGKEMGTDTGGPLPG